MSRVLRRSIVFALALVLLGACSCNSAKAEDEDQASPTTEQAFEKAEKDNPSEPGRADVLNGTNENLKVRVISWRDLPFQTVKRQTFDYSCGSAALATLLTYIYDDPTSESAVFKAMFDAGDKNKIRKQGFSLLDMKDYLTSHGYKAVGYKLSLDAIEKLKAPFIALINRDGYMHFVVVKSIQGPAVLIGDPNKGNVIYSREKFSGMWNGISLVVTNKARAARDFFANAKEWSYAHPAAEPGLGQRPGIDSVAMPFPNWQIAPVNMDIFNAVNSVTTTIR